MKCPFCSAKTQVTNSRSSQAGQSVWRRRSCKKCGGVWTTHEAYVLPKTYAVISPSKKHPQPFSRDILFMSIKDSLRHRKNAVEDASALTDTIIGKVLALKTPHITTDEITRLSTETLKLFDATAAAVYAATHGRV